MITRDCFKEKIEVLLDSAINRKTSQGKQVYEICLNELEKVNTQMEVDSLLVKFNRAMNGIEAHGHFTEDEYRIINQLRSYQK